ncbi:MAG: THUMP domain-containing protein [Crocinitomicaceae bacterium]
MLGVKQKEGKMWITLKTIFGLEEVLSEELKELGFEHVEILNRAVQVEGTWKDVYYLNLHVRCAIAVLVEVKKFRIRNEEELYERCMKIKWTSYFSKDKTFAVKGAVFSELFRHSQYPFLVVKDAIADTFRKEFDERPDVNIKKPQVMFDVYIRNKDVTISLNTSGLPLFQRGYREAVGIAPLNEVVAAGLIRMSGWDKKSTFVDPFCGSGTLLIEAALMAAGLPPQIERTHFAFKNFANYDEEVWDAILADVPRRVTELPCKIIGSDINAEMVTKTRRNLRGLSIGRFVETSVNSFQELKQIEGPGVMISNPPYGERMGEEIEQMYGELGDWMKGEMKGFNCWVLSSNKEAFKHVGLRPDRKIKVFNGDLECSFRKYSIYEGSKKAKFQNQDGSENAVDVNEEPKEEFQGKEHPKEEWMKAAIEKRREEKRSSSQHSHEKKKFEKKPYGRRNEEARQGRSKSRDFDKFDRKEESRPERKSRFEKPEAPRDSAKSSSKYDKKRVEPKTTPETKPESKDETKSNKVVIEPKVEKRAPSNKYAKKPEISSEEKPNLAPKKESSKEVSSEKKPESDSKDVKPISSYKTRSAKDKYGKK